MLIRPIDVPMVIQGVLRQGAVAVPLLYESVRLHLLELARQKSYRDSPVYVEQNGVRQEMACFENVIPGDAFTMYAQMIAYLFEQGVMGIESKAFLEPLVFNEIVLQRYRAGSIGISPHKDSKEYRNLVCLIVLGGKGTFYLCDDRQGNGERALHVLPGWMIVMQAPGLFGLRTRPFHGLKDVESERHVLALRQRRAS